MRCLLLVMCTYPFAKKALTLHLARSEGHERYLGCNLMHRKVLASSHQHLMAEAPYREEVLNAYLFTSTHQAQQLSDAWLVTCNEHRPHDALGRVPPLTSSCAKTRPF